MKTKYSCPICSQVFSRNWNMRNHNRTQHGFEIPHTKGDPVKYGFQNRRGNFQSTTLSADFSTKTLTALGSAMIGCLKDEELLTGRKTDFDFSSLTPEAAVEHLINKFVFLDKKRVNGLSGHICRSCNTFDYTPIRNIGWELVIPETHQCIPRHLSKSGASGPYNDELLVESTDRLAELSFSIFGSTINLTADSSPCPLYIVPDMHSNFCYGNFHAPVIFKDCISDKEFYTLINRVILSSAITLDRQELLCFIRNVRGTYAILVIQQGHLQIYRLRLAGDTVYSS